MISLSEVKEYLRIDYEDEDSFVESLIDISSVYIDSMVGEKYKEDESMVKLSNILQLKLISDMYEKRSTDVGSNSIDRISNSILDRLSNY